MEDEPNLPFIKCMIKETLRWMPTTLLGAVPHATTTDDTYKGYIIPKGAGVMNNVWTINSEWMLLPLLQYPPQEMLAEQP